MVRLSGPALLEFPLFLIACATIFADEHAKAIDP